MIFAVVDVETSSNGDINPATDECCEFAMIIADHDTKVIISQVSQIFSVKNWSTSSENIHKIPQHISNVQQAPEQYFQKLSTLLDLESVEYIIAHNAFYDKTVISRYWNGLANHKWICSYNDFDHKKLHNVTSKRLSHLATDYGILIQDWHRAHSDCQALLKIAYEHNLDDAWDRKNIKKFEVSASGAYVEGAPDQFKQHDWRWDATKKRWLKSVQIEQLKSSIVLAKDMGFKVVVEEITKNY